MVQHNWKRGTVQVFMYYLCYRILRKGILRKRKKELTIFFYDDFFSNAFYAYAWLFYGVFFFYRKACQNLFNE